jgi:hypothetical protein
MDVCLILREAKELIWLKLHTYIRKLSFAKNKYSAIKLRLIWLILLINIRAY